MTSPPQPVGQHLRPLRDLAAYALVGATALWLLVAVLDLIPGGSDEFSRRAEASFGSFVNLQTVLFPLGAVLLALLINPQHPKARLVVLVALIEYGVAAVFGVLFGLLVGLINTASDFGARAAFDGLLDRIAWLAVLAVAGYAVFVLWQKLFTAPKPPPGMYGQPPQFNPGAFPGQPGYGPGPGGPGFPPPAQGMPPQGMPPQGVPPQAPPPPGTYGQPPQPAPGWNQPPMPMQHHPAPPFPAPVSAQPSSGVPGSAPPYGAPAPAPYSEPTQAVPHHPGPGPADDDDRTFKLDEPRPGFGPAGQDPPRN